MRPDIPVTYFASYTERRALRENVRSNLFALSTESSPKDELKTVH